MNKFKENEYFDIARIIQGKPAVALSDLPEVWHNHPNAGYVEAAQLFYYHGTPLRDEALQAIGEDFSLGAYPEWGRLAAKVSSVLQRKTLRATQKLFEEFGYTVPASFYNVILATGFHGEETLMEMFKDKNALMQDRLWDAVLHAMLLVTPVGMHVQSVLSQYGLRFEHVMNCGCKIRAASEPAFSIMMDEELKPAYLQNMMAASFEQYGVNASTSKERRGF